MVRLIKISNRQQLTVLLKQGTVLRISGNRPHPSTDGHAHHFIVLNSSPGPEGDLLLVNGTHQVQRAVKFAELRDHPKETVVVISPGKYEFFPDQTAVDCNSITPMQFDTLLEVMDEGKLNVLGQVLSDTDVANILAGAIASPGTDDAQRAAILPASYIL